MATGSPRQSTARLAQQDVSHTPPASNYGRGRWNRALLTLCCQAGCQRELWSIGTRAIGARRPRTDNRLPNERPNITQRDFSSAC